MLKTTEKKFQKTKQTAEPVSEMTEILVLLDKEFKITMINMLRAVKEKVRNMQKQMGNVDREMEALRKNQKEILGIKSTVAEIKNDADAFISRLNIAKERISEFEECQ